MGLVINYEKQLLSIFPDVKKGDKIEAKYKYDCANVLASGQLSYTEKHQTFNNDSTDVKA